MLCYLHLSNYFTHLHLCNVSFLVFLTFISSFYLFNFLLFICSFICHFQEIIVISENNKSERLLCPLCNGVFRDPFIATCGVSLSHYLLSMYISIYLSIYLSLSLPASPLSLLPPSLPPLSHLLMYMYITCKYPQHTFCSPCLRSGREG